METKNGSDEKNLTTEGELKNFIFRDFFDDEVIEDEMDELEASMDELEASKD